MTFNVSRTIRSKRRTIALIVERDGSVTVRAPMKMSIQDIQSFVEKHARWVEKKQAEIQSMVQEQPRRYEAGEQFLYLGQAYPLEIVRDAGRKLVLETSFKLDASVMHNADEIFRDWYRVQARKLIDARVMALAEKHQISVGKIRITSARTRWGSCTSKGNLSFTWRLIMTPEDVIDYVVIHELAHVVYHNHSKRFWDLVEKWMPDYKQRRKQLKQYGQVAL